MTTEVILIPASVIIPTYNRIGPLETTLKTFTTQRLQFQEIIIIDASNNDLTEQLCQTKLQGLESKIIYRKAIKKGAASQRNEGFAVAQNPFIAFMDDDVYLEAFSVERLWNCFTLFPDAGGVSAMITNQKYEQLGKLTNFMCRLLSNERLSSYAGKCIGPGWNFLPSDDPFLPEYTPVDWLNLGLTIYRAEALPKPPFQSHFTGYSMMEDLTLSLIVGKKWKLYNARMARIYHDSQPGNHKSNIRELEMMELVNRHFIMTSVLGKNRLRDYCKLGLLETFKLFSLMSSLEGFKKIPSVISAKLSAIAVINHWKLN